MSVTARRFAARPVRTASATWNAISALLCQSDQTALSEFKSIIGTASSLIADEAMKQEPLVMIGAGPRIRIYCLYDDAAQGDDVKEDALSSNPTSESWTCHLPCMPEDLDWVNRELKRICGKFKAYDAQTGFDEPDEEASGAAPEFKIDAERLRKI